VLAEATSVAVTVRVGADTVPPRTTLTSGAVPVATVVFLPSALIASAFLARVDVEAETFRLILPSLAVLV
jgi:hypothetical protein